MRFYSLASSSKANCYVLEAEGKALLVDAGLGKRETLARLREAGISPQQVIAILVSHHHSDHAGKAGELSAGLHIPVYCSEETLERAPASLLAKADPPPLYFTPGETLFIGSFEVQPVLTYHTPGAVWFRVSVAGRHASIFTDVAELSGGVAAALERSHLAVVETDFLTAMLDGCDYDSDLKRRIKLTHTSVERLAEMFSNGFKWDSLRTVVLAHLSLKANVPFIAKIKISESINRPDINVLVCDSNGFFGPIEV